MSINNQQYIGDIHVMTAKNNKIKPKKFINFGKILNNM